MKCMLVQVLEEYFVHISMSQPHFRKLESTTSSGEGEIDSVPAAAMSRTHVVCGDDELFNILAKVSSRQYMNIKGGERDIVKVGGNW